MTDYKKLVEALRTTERICRDRMDGQVMLDAAAAIEAMIADVEKKESRITGLGNRIFALEQQLPKRGEWTTKRTWNHDGEIYCSVCDHDAPTEGDYRQVKTNYCPNCGAKMDGEV